MLKEWEFAMEQNRTAFQRVQSYAEMIVIVMDLHGTMDGVLEIKECKFAHQVN